MTIACPDDPKPEAETEGVFVPGVDEGPKVVDKDEGLKVVSWDEGLKVVVEGVGLAVLPWFVAWDELEAV